MLDTEDNSIVCREKKGCRTLIANVLKQSQDPSRTAKGKVEVIALSQPWILPPLCISVPGIQWQLSKEKIQISQISQITVIHLSCVVQSLSSPLHLCFLWSCFVLPVSYLFYCVSACSFRDTSSVLTSIPFLLLQQDHPFADIIRG